MAAEGTASPKDDGQAAVAPEDRRLLAFLDRVAHELNKERYWREIGARNLEELTLVQAADKGYYTFLTGICRSAAVRAGGPLSKVLREACRRELSYIRLVYAGEDWLETGPSVPGSDLEESYAMGAWKAVKGMEAALDRVEGETGTADRGTGPEA